MNRFSVILAFGLLASGSASAACTVPSGVNARPSFETLMETQPSDQVVIKGGCIDNTPIGQNTPAAGTFTTITAGGPAVCDGVHLGSGNISSGTKTFFSGQASFTSLDIGKKIVIQGAGAAGATLATTIASVTNSTNVVLTDAAGTTVGSAGYAYGSDYTAQIQAAIDAGRPVHLPRGECGISSTLALKTNTVIQGYGGGGQFPPPTSLLWLSASATPMMTIDTGTIATGVGLSGFVMHGMCAATIGIDSFGLQQSVWRDVGVINTTDIGFHFDVSDDTNFDTSSITMIKLSPSVQNSCAADMRGIVVEPGNVLHELTRSTFIDTFVLNMNGVGIDLYGINSSVFFNTRVVDVLGGTGASIEFRGNATAPMHAHANSFYGLEASNVVNSRTAAVPASGNIIYGWDDSTYPATVNIESGSTLRCSLISGVTNNCTPHAFYGANKGNPTGTTSTAAFVMSGLAGAFTTQHSGNVAITITGLIQNNTASPNGGQVTMYYGTGAAPANGDAATGTTCGSVQGILLNPASTPFVPFSITCNVPSLTNGTAYWFDAGVKSITGGTTALFNVYMTATEAP